MNEEVVWLSIFEYSKTFKKSISTIRRYIKAGKLITKTIEGKYYIKCENEYPIDHKISHDELTRLNKQITFLKKQLIVAKEEISELRMLVDLYESDGPPLLPNLNKLQKSLISIHQEQ